MIVWIALAVLVAVCLGLVAWMGLSLVALAHRIGTPRKRPSGPKSR